MPLFSFCCCWVRSFILSVDMAHAVHPNYASKHDKSHSPTMNGGLVIKSNSNQRFLFLNIIGNITPYLQYNKI